MYPENTHYKISTTVMAISMFATYLIAYSSIIKLMLDSGKFEPRIIKVNSYFVILMKILFLTFVGPLYILFIELLSTIMAVCQANAMLIIGYKGYDQVRANFMYLFENVLNLDEERAEGLRQ
jgi:hypothetical protein